MAESRFSLRNLLELAALSGFAIVQPVLDVMGRSPEVFVFHGADRIDILLVSAALAVIPPLVLWQLETLVGLVAGTRARRVVHLVLLTALAAAIAIQALKATTEVRGPGAAGLALAAAVVATTAYVRVGGIRTWLAYLSPSPLLFATLFLVTSQVSTLVFSGSAAGASPVVPSGAPVVMVVLDELPLTSLLDGDGAVDARLYPNFARLAQGTTWLRNTTAAAAYTPVAVPAMLTGRWPDGRSAPVLADHPENLFTLLGGAYDVVAFESVTALCPHEVCGDRHGEEGRGLRTGALLSDAISLWQDLVAPDDADGDITQTLREDIDRERWYRAVEADERLQGALEENQPDRFNEFMTRLDGDAPPTFWFLHLLMPHTPWRYLPSGALYDTRGFGKRGDRWIEDEWATVHHHQRHLLQAVYTDGLLGQILDRLVEEGIYDEAVLVVASDHGAGFVPGERSRRLDEANTADLAWVPLFVKVPGQTAGEVRDDNTSTIDIVPTIADALGFDLPWAVDGVSVLSGEPRPTDRKRFDGKPTRVLNGSRWLPVVLQGALSRFGTPIDDVDSLYRIGPHPELVGTAVDAHGRDEPWGSAAVDELAAFDRVDRRLRQVPALVTGRLEPAADEGRRHEADPIAAGDAVAVALNGTIAAVSGTFEQDGRRFAALASDAFFAPGPNHLELFFVRPDGRLAPIEIRG